MHSAFGQRPWTFTELTAPASEPVSADQVKEHRRMDVDDDTQDAIIEILIEAARRYAESYTGRTFIQRTFRATGDGFPGCGGHQSLVPGLFRGHRDVDPTIYLDRGPVVSVDSVKYLDTTGTQQTLDPSQYVVDLTGMQARIAPAFGAWWPPTLLQIGAVTVDFTAGYGVDATGVPKNYCNWLLIRVGTLFENREEAAVIAKGRIEPVPVLDSLLGLDRVPVI